jgi:hypothetical protein
MSSVILNRKGEVQLAALEGVLQDLAASDEKRRKKLGIPAVEYSSAKGRLKRIGVRFVMTIRSGLGVVVVPIRIISDHIHNYTCDQRKLWRFWNQRPICDLQVYGDYETDNDRDRLLTKLVEIVKTAFHRIERKMNQRVHKAATKEKYRRVEAYCFAH